MTSPFKLLDAYTAADQDQFLGRDEEVAALYGMVLKNRLILVYGQSGTGKTSLIQCGLASRFDVTDWYPVFVRRQNDLNESLDATLRSLSGQPRITSAADALETIYETYLRPVYLIFDQLEEVFILGTAAEQEIFAQTIRSLLESNAPCRILFVIREEYLAYLYGFERTVPTLFDRRLRVEAMSRIKVQTVLDGLFQRFNIKAQAPAETTYGHIIDNISGGKAGIQLPYLQVYLDMLYREDFARTYPGQEPFADGVWQPLEFDRRKVEGLGKIENVLERFVREQKGRIQSELKQQYPDIEDDAVQKVLDAFVSDEGTKRPVGCVWKGRALQPEPRWAELFQPLSPEILGDCCRRLEQARLLRFADHHAELAHDSLALLINSQRSDQQRRLQEARNRLLSQYSDFRDTGEYLSRRQLNYLDDFMPLLEPRLDAGIRAFVCDSQDHATAAEQAELVAERQKRQQARRIAVIGLTLATLAIIGLLLAVQQYRIATARKAELAREALRTQLKAAETLKLEGNYPQAVEQLRATDAFTAELSATEQEDIRQKRDDWQQVAILMIAGDSLIRIGDLSAAIGRYESAYRISPDHLMEQVIEQTNRDLDNRFKQLMLNGEAFLNAKQFRLATDVFEEALRLKPGNEKALKSLIKARGK